MNTNTEMKINCGVCGGENDRTKNGQPCIEIDGKGACLKCVISSTNKDSEEFGKEKCFNCDCELTDDIHIFCFEREGSDDMTMCAECGDDLADDLREEGWKRDDDDDEEMSECDECGELFELGTFNTIEEDDGTQFCFCNTCAYIMRQDGDIERTPEDTIYRRVVKEQV